jgi:hypothetical protein
MRRICTSFETVTPESAAEGDFSDSGWTDKDGEELDPSADDVAEHGTEEAAAVVLAVRFLEDRGSVEPSSSPTWHPRVWYSTTDPNMDYATGAETRHSFHLKGYSEKEEREIYRVLTRPLADKLRDAGRAIRGE